MADRIHSKVKNLKGPLRVKDRLRWYLICGSQQQYLRGASLQPGEQDGSLSIAFVNGIYALQTIPKVS